jgi:hypothetical protein
MLAISPMNVATMGVLDSPFSISMLGLSISDNAVYESTVNLYRPRHLRGGSGSKNDERHNQRAVVIDYSLKAFAPFIDFSNELVGSKNFTVDDSTSIIMSAVIVDVNNNMNEHSEILISAGMVRRND